jgi:hypothetical protein
MNAAITAAFSVLLSACFFCFGILAIAFTGSHVGGMFAAIAAVAGIGACGFALLARDL